MHVYCPYCRKVNKVRVPLLGNLEQFAVDHGDHVLVFAVDSHGAVRSTHVLKVLNNEEPQEESFDNYADIKDNVVEIVTFFDGEKVVLEEVPLVGIQGFVEDEIRLALDSFGEGFLAEIIIGIASDTSIRADGGLEIAKKIIALLDGGNYEVSSEVPDMELDDYPYVRLIIQRIVKEDNPDTKIFIAKQIVSVLKAVVNFIVNNIHVEVAREEIRSIFSNPEREPLKITIINILNRKDTRLSEELRSLLS